MKSNMIKHILMIITLMVMMAATGLSCGRAGLESEGEIVQSKDGVAQSEKVRDMAPVLNQAELEKLVAGNNEFALELYQQLRDEQGNLFFSPYSISIALAMTYAGARGDTEQQMSQTLHFLLEQDRLHHTFNALDLLLASRGQGAVGQDGKPFRLNIANSLWGRADAQFLGEFLDVLAQNYGAGLQLMDFQNAAEQARVTINQWVSDQTAGKIKDLIPQGAVDAWTRLVLVNAIYFNAAWQYKFNESLTHDAPFYLLDGSQVTVPMMFQTGEFRYAAGDGYQAIELPYDGGELSMVILLPTSGKFEDFEKSLDADKVKAIIDKLGTTEVNISMPRFKFAGDSVSLKKVLSEMGMPIAFSEGAADFSGMDGSRNLFIGDVIHKAFISVNESGTEAAAATAVVLKDNCATQTVAVTLDHPFIYLIRDNQTGSILFMGRVMNPSA